MHQSLRAASGGSGRLKSGNQTGSLPRGGRRWWPRLLLAIGVPAIFFLGLEGVLRVAGYGYATTFFLNGEVKGRPVWVDNWQFGWRFFPRGAARMPQPLVMPKQKTAGTIRVFVLGESAALGYPAPEYGFSRMLEVLLRERFPDRSFEVINVSMVAINSHAILPIARECARREGDLWVIYMGNNEVIGPFGASGVFGAQAPSLPVIQANLALKTTRTAQLLDAGLQKLRGGAAAAQWRGMQMWKEAVSRDDPRIGRVLAHFRENLAAILRTGEQTGTPIILSTVACNLRDCSPFASLHRAGLTPVEQAAWKEAFEVGAVLEARGKFEEALGKYESAAHVDDRFAELQFRLGRCCQALGRGTEARHHFQRAKDEDGLQFRPDTRLNESIRQLAGEHSAGRVRLLDAEELFTRSSPGGIPGEEMFYEHVHLTPAGNYLLARATAELAARMIGGIGGGAKDGDAAGTARPISDGGDSTNGIPWLSQAECEQRLGLTDWSRFQMLQVVQDLLGAPPFTSQSIHAGQLQKVRAELKRLRPALRPASVQQAARKVQEAVDRRPGDAELLQVLAPLLEAADDPRGAEQRWREVNELLPQAPIPFLNLAQLLNRQGRQDEAALAYEQCLRRNPDNADAQGELGVLRLSQGRPAEAIPHLRRLVQQQPESVAGHWRLAQALLQSNQRADAVAQLHEVLRLDPSHAEARKALDTISRGS